ncbi:acetylglutamate kinase [Anaerofustis stercorihominis]|uniref:Acetylglutamate kinase n=1 Tax=Anaerofustis stercorihominis TaxID=214853 RepID=A0A3E3DY58_9FIRM|nr:acetylglutamate kinase [Anaerofustis stercorihominis]RGD74202.1 acetylglutamate kinase [Anaerofustis stercorihominis]
MDDKYMEKANILIEALPYIKEFYGEIVVIKYGGAALVDKEMEASVINDIALMKLVGIMPVIVHGGGKDINKMLDRVGKEHKFINGLRYTDNETMDIVQMVLAGGVNKDLVSLFTNQGMNAIGISGQDGHILEVEKHTPGGDDIGYVGKIKSVNPMLIAKLIDDDFIPIIAPVGVDETGHSYNINADFVACHVASALSAKKLLFMSDIEGVLDKDKNLIRQINIGDVQGLIDDGTIDGGMIPKIKGAKESVENGVEGVHIIDGRVEHSLLIELFTNYGIGTMIKE